MAQLQIITETGMFHVACRCNIEGQVSWYGFKPLKSMSPVYKGYVDESDRTALINHYVTFKVDDASLRKTIMAVRASYNSATYAVGVKDCVSFGADIARGVGLKVPLVNMTPYGFIKVLAFWNETVESS